LNTQGQTVHSQSFFSQSVSLSSFTLFTKTMQDISAIQLIKLEIQEAEKLHEVALQEDNNEWKVRKIEERIKQLKNTLKYVQELCKRR
jgi:hypothetical protein